MAPFYPVCSDTLRNKSDSNLTSQKHHCDADSSTWFQVTFTLILRGICCRLNSVKVGSLLIEFLQSLYISLEYEMYELVCKQFVWFTRATTCVMWFLFLFLIFLCVHLLDTILICWHMFKYSCKLLN